MDKTKREPRVIPADEYDTLELMAEAFGGIGQGEWFRFLGNTGGYDPNCPICVNGLGIAAGMSPASNPFTIDGSECGTVTSIGVVTNDDIVDRLVAQGRYTTDSFGIVRVSFADYCEEGDIIRRG